MKFLKTIGLATVAALLLLSFVGISSAFAAQSVLCKTSGPICMQSNAYPSGTTLKASPSSTIDPWVELAGTEGRILCGESTVEGKTTATSGEPLPGEISSWTLGNCTSGGTACTVSATVGMPASASLEHTGSSGSNGRFTIIGSEGKGIGWHIECEKVGISCNYTFSKPPRAIFEGGEHDALWFSKSIDGEGSCFANTIFEAYYEVTPHPAYVAELLPPGTVLCKANESPCAFGNQYPSGTEFAAAEASGTKFEIQMSPEKYTCTNSSFSGKTTARTAEGGVPASISALSLSGCEFTNGKACENEGSPSTATFVGGTEGNSEKRLEVANFSLLLHCAASGIECTFYASTGWFTIAPGAPATLSINEAMGRKGLGCPSSATFKATYNLTSPNPFYLSTWPG